MDAKPSAGMPGRRAVARSLALVMSLLLGGAGRVDANGLLVDFGAPDSLSGGGTGGTTVYWNNVTASTGAAEGAEVPFLMNLEGETTAVSLQILSRFNGANENGATVGGPYPGSATRDSLYGNTELFGSLENVTPRFKLYGLDAGASVGLTFYASRLGVADNRETRYTVIGEATAHVDLDAANNTTNTVRMAGVIADAAGEITIELSAGPNNNNANHFTYLGVLQLELPGNTRVLIDFGAAGTPTEAEEPGPAIAWNNLTTDIGTNSEGQLAGLVTTNGTATEMALQMVARFNGANLNGSTAATVFPATATRDSLFGNTATFSGLENVFPGFKLTGLNPDYAYDFTFYGSRTGVSDNRETRYTVRGTAEEFADLDTANNVDGVAQVKGIRPDASGEVTVSLSAGPNNNNGNRFTYLGAMRVDFAPVLPPTFLIDFGATGTPTMAGAQGVDVVWNNVTPTVGGFDSASISNLVRADGTATPVVLQMVSRFNGANESGTTFGEPFPATATRDSLFGNTEEFSGLSDVTPIFKLSGLNPATAYSLEFYASRMGVGDIRETRYTVQGATEKFADLDASNNELNTVTIADVQPDASGEITISLTPGPNNDNGNHFTYLGVLRVTWTASEPPQPAAIDQVSVVGGSFRFRLTGTSGASYQVQASEDLRQWTDVRSVTLSGASATVEIPTTGSSRFFQVVAVP